MKFDLSQFKKVKEDEHTAVMQHPEGHHIVIAKALLSPKAHAELKKLPVHASQGIDIPENADSQLDIEPLNDPHTRGRTVAMNDPSPVTMADDASMPTGSLNDPNQGQAPTQEMSSHDPAKAQETNFNIPKAQPAPPPMQLPPEDIQGMRNAAGAQVAGLQGQARAAETQGRSEAKTAGDTADSLTKINQTYQGNVSAYQKYHDQVMSDHENGHIQPNHYLENMDAGKKVRTGIGLVLGGIGGGLLGQSNPVMDFINKQTDRDIAAQQANFNNKDTLLKANMQMMGNMKDATDMTRVNLLGINAAKFQQAGAQAKTDSAKYIAMQQAGALQQQIIPIIDQMARRNALTAGMGQGGTDQQLQMMRMVDPARAKEMEERYIPGVGMASVKVPDKIREELVGRADLQSKVQELRNYAQQHSGSIDPHTVNYGKALASQVQDAYRRANGQGVFREAEAHFVSGIVDQDPTKFFSSFRTDPKYKALEDSNGATVNNLRKSYGLPTQARTGQVQTMPKRSG